MMGMYKPSKPRELLLVVDDDDDFRGSLAEALELEGYLVAEASNGAQALEWLREGERPAAVLLDLWMPTMDGWQLRLALEERCYDDLAVVVMTAARTQDAEVLRVGEVLEKPFTIPEVVAALKRAQRANA
jgi:two-component system, OmpR family, response regulator MprA